MLFRSGTEKGVKANWFAGSVENGQLLYRLTPYAPWTGTAYDGKDLIQWGNYSVDLRKSWIVEIVRGEPVLQVQDLQVQLGDHIYHGKIDEENSRITLLLPEGTDLTAITPILTHTAAKAMINGQQEGAAVNLTETSEIILSVDKYTRKYELQVSTGKSDECQILSWKIGEKEEIGRAHV